MIAYMTLGTNDIERAAAFYDALLAPLDAKRVLEMDRLIAWGNSPNSPTLCVASPYDGNTATVGNGVMVALQADSEESVDACYANALSLGAKDEGEPGLRQGVFYIGYFRDLDGNKLNFFHLRRQLD